MDDVESDSQDEQYIANQNGKPCNPQALLEMDGLDLDLSEQDEVEPSDKQDDSDIEKELLANYEDEDHDKSKIKALSNHLEKSKQKKKKAPQQIEEDDEEEDSQSLSKKNKIKRILDLAKSNKGLTNSLAIKLLSLFRTAILLSNSDNENKDKESKNNKGKSKKPKSNDEEITVGKDKEVEIIISSNPLLYKDIIKTSVEKLPGILVSCIKAEVSLDNPTEERYKALKKAYSSTNKTLTIQMRSFITNYIKLLKSGSETENVEMFLVSILD